MTNPFKENTTNIEDNFMNWKDIYPASYDAKEVSPYTKLRIILMNGTEFEANWFMHQFSRHCNNNDLRREVALIRAQEQQQQKKLACLKPLLTKRFWSIQSDMSTLRWTLRRYWPNANPTQM